MFAHSRRHFSRSTAIALAVPCAMALQVPTAFSKTVDVEVSNNAFSPPNINIEPGDTVRWTWVAGTHTTTSNGHWNSGQLTVPAVFPHTASFANPGTYSYFCALHAGMTGSVTVAPSATASPSPFPTPSAAACVESNPVNVNPIPAAIARSSGVDVVLRDVVSANRGLVSPNWGIAAPGDRRHLFVTDTVGKLWAIDVIGGSKNPVLDVSAVLVPNLGFAGGYDERGLLGVAFHPKYRRNGLVYLFTSEAYDPAVPADFTLRGLLPGAAPDHRSVISEWRVDNPRALQPVISGGRRVLMRIDHPQFNHNGGALNFGRDGFLHIALGDGGGADDQDTIGGHDPNIGNGQDRSTVLGKILRIDPRRRTAVNGQYGIPRSNPFARRGSRGGEAGCGDGVCDEIWAYGFRNPYRFSFDGGNLLAADVGQNKIEEVDWVRKGRNYGWRHKEGTFFFQPAGGSGTAFVSAENCRSVPTAGLTDPLAQYDHDEGLAVVGGFVYRGRAIARLRGQYLFGDYAGSASTPAGSGRLFRIQGGNLRGARPPLRRLTELRMQGDVPVGMAIYGFGRDARGELYVMGNTSGVPAPKDALGNYLETGVIKKLAPASSPAAVSPRPTAGPTPAPSASPY